MNLLLTSAGPGSHPDVKRAFLRLLKKKPSSAKILMVTTAKKESKDWKYVLKTIRQLNTAEIRTENIHIFNFERKIQKSDIQGIDCILVCGGNTFSYLDKIRKTGLDTAIKKAVKNGIAYCGISAGSIIACPTIETAQWGNADRNMIGLRDLRGLSLVPFLVTVHSNSENTEATKKAAAKSRFSTVAITDRQAIQIIDGIGFVMGAGSPPFLVWCH